jgi:hypothetical protein
VNVIAGVKYISSPQGIILMAAQEVTRHLRNLDRVSYPERREQSQPHTLHPVDIYSITNHAPPPHIDALVFLDATSLHVVSHISFPCVLHSQRCSSSLIS